MSDEDWDAEDFEPKLSGGAAAGGDKWEGEDSDDDIKDNWDDDDDEEKKENTGAAAEVKKKKSLKERIAEKEAKRKAEAEAKRKAEEEAKANQTPEELAAEKLRQQKLQEDADLELAKDAFGLDDEKEPVGKIDAFNPESREDFDEFVKLLKDKVTQFERSPHYVPFLDALFRDLSLGLEAEDLKKLGSTLNTLGNEKAKQQKAKAGKKKKGGSKLNSGRDDNYDDYTVSAYDEFDDFI